jgi:hypothetical protein
LAFYYSRHEGNKFSNPKVGSIRNIEINGKTLINTKGLHAAYIAVAAGMRDPNYIWGTGIDGVEVRNNSITGRAGTPRNDYFDGYTNNVLYADPDGPYSPNGSAYGVVGTIFQGNNCTSCTLFYSLRSLIKLGCFGFHYLELDNQWRVGGRRANSLRQ